MPQFSGSPGNMSSILQKFLTSLSSQRTEGSGEEIKPFPSLTELLSPSTTIPFIIQARDESLIDRMLLLLPTEISELMLKDTHPFKLDKRTSYEFNIRHLTTELKKELLLKILRSPQLCQSFDSLSIALRGGGLLAVSEALDIDLNMELATENANNDTASISPIQIFLNGIKSGIGK